MLVNNATKNRVSYNTSAVDHVEIVRQEIKNNKFK